MIATSLDIAGLRTVMVTTDDPGSLVVVVLHGYAMSPEDLTPFARSLGLAARFLFPEGPVEALPAGRAWWAIDLAARAIALRAGPRDLHREHPAGAARARMRLVAFLEQMRGMWGESRVVLVGFSQGGMLACDLLLRETVPVGALALLSSSRIAADEWDPLVTKLRGMPVLVSHGAKDPDLAFAAGEALRDLLVRGGAQMTWVPHEHGHEIPLVVWRQLRKFLRGLA